MEFLLIPTAVLTFVSVQVLAAPSCKCPQQYYAGQSGIITSPNYPQDYCAKVCIYSITVFNGLHVRLTFNDYQTESGYDYIYVFDGPKTDDTTNQIAKFSGSYKTSNSVFYSGQNMLAVMFAPDGSQFLRGFNASFTAVSNICGQTTFSGTSGVVSSPNWPNNYPNNIQCVWSISVPTGKVIQLTFANNSRTEPNDDQVTVAGSGGVVLNEFSGTNFQTVTTTGNYMTIQFKTDYDVIYPGFSATFKAITPPTDCSCGQTTRYVDVPTGQAVLTSPNYPQSYCSHHNCTWYLRVPDSFNVAVSFTMFDLERNYDNLFIYSGLGTAGHLLEVCTGSSCNSVISSGQWMTIQFTTDGSVQAKGFKGIWRPVLA